MDNWVYAIPLAAIIGGITVAIFAMYFKTKKDIAMGTGAGVSRATDDTAETNRQLLARLDSLDARLAAIEGKVSRMP